MPATRAAIALTNGYRRRLLDLRQRAVAAASQAWRLDFANLDRSYAAWLAATTSTTTIAQTVGAQLSDAYLAAYLGAELGAPVDPVGIDPHALSGQAADGRSLAVALLPALFTVKLAIGQGRPLAAASSLGLSRARRLVGDALLATPRRALDQASERQAERLLSWRRVTAANACGACLGSAAGEHPLEEPLHLHGNCRCTKEFRVRDVEEKWLRPTGEQIFQALSAEDQNNLFRGRGGERKAELIRSGQIALANLVAKAEMATATDGIQEAPLSALLQTA